MLFCGPGPNYICNNSTLDKKLDPKMVTVHEQGQEIHFP